jgi:adenylate cyclase
MATSENNNSQGKRAPRKKVAKARNRVVPSGAKLHRILLDITNQLAQSNSLDEALEKFIDILSEQLHAERSTVFLNDPRTGELYSRVAQGDLRRRIRILNNHGVAGWCFTNAQSLLIPSAYEDERFSNEFDVRTGFETREIISTPLRDLSGEIIGVSQVLNRIDGNFDDLDLSYLERISAQATIGLQPHVVLEQIEASRRQEAEFLQVVSSVSSEINLGPLLNKIISAITNMLDAERSTLFINDEKTSELYTEFGEGIGKTQLRIPNHAGIAGYVFQTGEAINIPYAYADLRFNPSFDKQTGFFTRSILCMPVINKAGKIIGVTQVLNKRGGAFTKKDEQRLSAFTSQISIGIENAKLFNDVHNMKNYNESVLESMSNAVLTTDQEGAIVTCNAAGTKMMGVDELEILGKHTEQFFTGDNRWVHDKLQSVWDTGNEEIFMDAEIKRRDGKVLSANLTALPLVDMKEQKLGTMLMLEDISGEKRMKSTMARYMDPNIADQLLESDTLGGMQSVSTVLFSDIRSFTTLTEELGPQGTVSLLNDYFTVMVECISSEGGMLDKFIGDAIMAIFGVPIPHDDDPDRAMRTAIAMMRELEIFNAKRLAEGKKPIDHGVGINTDNVVSGNIGSPKRMNYTVIGDGVNLASRLESACKQYGAHILASELTVKQLRGTYRMREVDRVVVKGKTAPVAVYEMLDYHNEESFPDMIEVVGHFNDGFSLYRQGKWDQAMKSFREALRIHPGDRASATYIERCEQLKADKPADWNGVWIMKTK